jgi:hypothetical protein
MATTANAPIGPYRRSVRKAWLAAAQVRNAALDRIVVAFRKQIEDGGPGPADADLLLFARVAIAERRLLRRLAHSKDRFARRRKPRGNQRSSGFRTSQWK